MTNRTLSKNLKCRCIYNIKKIVTNFIELKKTRFSLSGSPSKMDIYFMFYKTYYFSYELKRFSRNYSQYFFKRN